MACEHDGRGGGEDAYESLSTRELLDKLTRNHLRHSGEMERVIIALHRLYESAEVISRIDAVLVRRFSVRAVDQS